MCSETKALIWQIFWCRMFLVCSYQPRAEGTERNSGRNQGQWLLDNRSICELLSFHYLPTSIAAAVFFMDISIVTSDSLFVRGQSFLDNWLLMVQYQLKCSAVWKHWVCVCVRRTRLKATVYCSWEVIIIETVRHSPRRRRFSYTWLTV